MRANFSNLVRLVEQAPDATETKDEPKTPFEDNPYYKKWTHLTYEDRPTDEQTRSAVERIAAQTGEHPDDAARRLITQASKQLDVERENTAKRAEKAGESMEDTRSRERVERYRAALPPEKKWSPDKSPTPDQMFDYRLAMDDMQRESDETGVPVERIKEKRAAAAIEARREAARKQKQAADEAEQAKRLEKIYGIGAKIGVDSRDISVHQRVSDATAMVRALTKKDPSKDEEWKTITDEEWKTADIEARHKKTKDRRREVEGLQRQVRTLVGRYGNIGATEDEKGNVTGGGIVTLPSGETIDINKLQKAVDAFDPSVFIRKQTQRIRNKDTNELEDKEVTGKEELADPTTKDYQDNLRHLAELGRATRLASQHFSELEHPTKPKTRDETLMSVGDLTGASPSPTKTSAAASSAPVRSPASPVSSGGQLQPQTAVQTAQSAQKAREAAAEEVKKGADVVRPYSTNIPTPQTTGFSPLNAATKSAADNRLAAVVGPVIDTITRQQQLTRSVATPQQTPSQSGERPTEVASAESAGSKKDARYKAKKATAQGVVAVTEQRLQFNKNELKDILNEAWGPRQWRNWAKYVATPALKQGGKLLKDVSLQHLARTSINPIDRYPTNIFQAGYSKAKSLRQARYLYKNPTKLLSALTAIPQLSALSGIAGAGVIGGLGKLGIGGDEAKQSLASLIPTWMGIVNDPRDTAMDPGHVARDDDDDTEDLLNKLMGKKAPTGTP